MFPTIPAVPIDPALRTDQIGVVDTCGGIITVDTKLPQFFKKLHVGTGGDLVVLGKNNEYIPYRNIASGDWLFVLGYAVVSSAVIDGVTVTTTASNIDWYGGV